jgi:peroxiredoxin
MRNARAVILSLATVILVTLAQACAYKNLAGQPATDFFLSDFKGKSWASQDLKNDKVLLFFFDPECDACLSAPNVGALTAVAGEGEGKLKMLAMLVDPSGDFSHAAEASQAGLGLPLLVAHPKLAAAYGAKSYPYFVLLDQGKIALQFSGSQDQASLEAKLAPWLK